MGFSHLLTDFVWVSSRAGTNSYGDSTYGAWVKVPAAIEHGTSKVFDTNGTELTSTASFSHAVPIDIDARIVFSVADQADPDKYKTPIFTAKTPSRSSATIHYETYL